LVFSSPQSQGEHFFSIVIEESFPSSSVLISFKLLQSYKAASLSLEGKALMSKVIENVFKITFFSYRRAS